MKTKPTVTLKCQADTYSGPNERIIEISAGTKGAGCLVSLMYDEDENMIYLDVYRRDSVSVMINK